MGINIDQSIIDYSKTLHLPTFRRDFKELSRQAAEDRADYEPFLNSLMERESDMRAENRKKSAIRQAGFPSKMYLNLLEREQLPEAAKEKLLLLERLDFIEEGRNIILFGNPGTGETHIAVRLGLKACLKGYKIFFTTIHGLLTRLRESHSELTLRQMESRFEKYDLVSAMSSAVFPLIKKVQNCFLITCL